MDEDLKQHLEAMEARLKDFTRGQTAEMASHILAEMSRRFNEVDIRTGDMDRRLRRVDASTITTMELLTRQSRWHEESDNSIHDMIKRQDETDRKLNELRARLEKLEKAS